MQAEACRTLLDNQLNNEDLLFVFYFGDDISKEKANLRLKELRRINKKSE